MKETSRRLDWSGSPAVSQERAMPQGTPLQAAASVLCPVAASSVPLPREAAAPRIVACPSEPAGVGASPMPARELTVVPTAPAGWGDRTPEVDAHGALAGNLSAALVEILKDLGVEAAFGLIGGSIAPFAEALDRGAIDVVHCRHEGGAVFAAIESSFVRGRPVLVFATTGPGVANAITGMMAARRDGSRVILVSGSTAAPQRGHWAFQETSTHTMPVSGLYAAGPLFHYAVTIEQSAELPLIARKLALGLQQPGGFVAHIAVPLAVQSAPADAPQTRRRVSIALPGGSREAAAEHAKSLMDAPFAIWLGFGARGAARPIRALAERTGAAVMCSPRAKGIFPEGHPQFLGVTGFGGHDSVRAFMIRERPRHVLVLGTRLGEFTSFWDPTMTPSRAFIHVDIDPEVPGVAYPYVQTLGVQAEIGEFVEALLEHIPEASARPVPTARHTPPVPPACGSEGPVRPEVLMAEIQRIVVEGSDAVVMTEAGNAFAWGSHALRFDAPGRYRVSTGFGSMGHATAGVIGAAMARRGKAVAVVGDGAMLMNSEVSTAVQHGIPAVWIVLNDAQYGMIDHGMRALGMDPVDTDIPQCDFVMIARGMGADGVRVEREDELDAALIQAMAAPGPFVVDVVVDSRVSAPFHGRNQSLNDQGARPSKP